MTVCELIDILKAEDPTMTVVSERGDYSGHGVLDKPVLYVDKDDGTLVISAWDDDYPDGLAVRRDEVERVVHL